MIEEPRLRELHMGVLEERILDGLTEQEEVWRKQMVDGSPKGRIPEGETMTELATRMRAALDSCLELPAGSKPLLVSHGIALGSLISTILGLPAYAEASSAPAKPFRCRGSIIRKRLAGEWLDC